MKHISLVSVIILYSLGQMCQLCIIFKKRILKVWFLNEQHPGTWELITKTSDWTPSQNHFIRNCGAGSGNLCLIRTASNSIVHFHFKTPSFRCAISLIAASLHGLVISSDAHPVRGTSCLFQPLSYHSSVICPSHANN